MIWISISVFGFFLSTFQSLKINFYIRKNFISGTKGGQLSGGEKQRVAIGKPFIIF